MKFNCKGTKNCASRKHRAQYILKQGKYALFNCALGALWHRKMKLSPRFGLRVEKANQVQGYGRRESKHHCSAYNLRSPTSDKR